MDAPIAIFKTTLPALADGMQVQLQVDASGRLIVSDAGSNYQYVDPGSEDVAIGAGKVGDRIAGVLLVPVNENVGYCLLQDGAGAELPIMAGGVLTDLTPIWMPLKLTSKSGGWKITSGGNVGIWVLGSF